MNNDEVRELGKRLFDNKEHPVEIYRQLFGLKLEDQSVSRWDVHYGTRWQSFSDGWNESRREYMLRRRKELKVDDFLTEFKDLCRKYNATVWWGGGDCDYGLAIEDYEFTLDVEL